MKKNTLLLFMILLFSASINAQDNFNQLWLQVERLEVSNLPKSAHKIVDKIYAKAIKEKQSPQIIKSLFYKSKFSLILEENAQLKVVNEFKEHIAKSSFPTKNVLENVLANLYWQYFNSNKYRFYRRTKTESKVDKTDFRTWDLDTLFKEIHYHFESSLSEVEKLQKVNINTYSDILKIQLETEKYRPTLFDFLANNALLFYKTPENAITKPAYEFKINNTDYLCDVTSFTDLKLSSKDSSSLQFNTLKTYQNLLKFHLKNNNLDALADADVNRINFVAQNATFNTIENKKLETLNNTKEIFKKETISGLYDFEIAKIYSQQALSYNTTKNEDVRFKNKEALAICNNVINNFPNSFGARKCSILKDNILQKSIQVTAEKYIPTNTSSKILVDYKNLNKLFLTVYKVSEKQIEKLNKTSYSKKVAFINTLQKETSWHTTLRDEKDYLKHTTEVVVPKLNNGSYLIVASEEVILNPGRIIGTSVIQITDLTLVENHLNNIHNYQVVSRKNGQPIANAQIHLQNPKTKYYPHINKKLVTDANGFASYKVDEYYRNVNATVTFKDDSVVFGNFYLNQNYDYNRTNKTDQTFIKPFIFTDRSIYRPGQTIYFKSIFIQQKGENHQVFKDLNVMVTLYDVNNQIIKTHTLKLNEFGSVAGNFTLPNNGLTGSFRIEVNSISYNRGYAQISVEEYKRPKFATEFKPVKKTYKINDSVTVNGFAKAFSGANITDAKVVYRVHRTVQYPSWYYSYYWRIPNPASSSQEITHGESITNEKGEFSITFKALPDDSVKKENLPVFTYEITADVTDVNGETRSETTQVKVGYHALLANINIDDKINKKDKNTLLKIDTKNLNGEFIPATGTVKIYKLVAPKTAQRKRVWDAPDYQDIIETDFRELFPNEPYNNQEANEKDWIKGAVVFNKNFDTSKSKEFILKNNKKWISGKYIVVLESKDKFGQTVKDEKRFDLFTTNEKTVADNQLFFINTDKKEYQPNDIVNVEIGSTSKDITVVVQIEKDYKIIQTNLIHLNNEIKSLSIPVTKQDIGGFAVKYHFVNYNSFNSGSLLIKVPEKREPIELITNVFRNKLQPGQEETWSFKVKNDKNDKITAEVLASMYDASLDQFKPHSWSFNPITPKPTYYSHNKSQARFSFDKINFSVINSYNGYASYPIIYNNKYNWFGFGLNNSWINNSYLNEIKRKLTSERKEFDRTISGVITDEKGAPLPGITVYIKGTVFGSTTDFDGKYTIKVKKGDVLVFNSIGYLDKEISVTDDFENINVKLKEDLNALDEVVVTALGIKKEKISSSSKRALDPGLRRPAPAMAMEVVENDVEEELTGAGFNSLERKQETKLTEKEEELSNVKARTNLQETAFFFPQLKTNEEGEVSFNFTTPEALTSWKLQLLAHTKDAKHASKTLQTVTQKELMVVPNAPRFLRQGDAIVLSAKISNLSDKNLNGLAQLQLTDAITGKEINTDLQNNIKNKEFTVDTNGNTNVSWELTIPYTLQSVQYKIVAKAGDFSDGEQNVLPVLTNRMLVTETIPMWVHSNQTKTFSLEKLKNQTSTSLSHHKLTLEVTSNPVWYAVQALPYLMEYPYECAEQTFSRYYANTIASFVANSNPKIQKVFNAWKSSDALLSNLEKNQELKSLIIQETPWLRDAQSETEQKKRIALLFDLHKMKNEQEKAINKLKDIQKNSGGFPWFKNGRYESRFITQHIATGFGHLQKLGISDFDTSTKKMIKNAVSFLDNELEEQYSLLLKKATEIKERAKNKTKGEKAYKDYLAKNNLGYFTIQYLYMRSFYKDLKINKKTQTAVDYYTNQTITYWNDYNLYAKGQIALSLFRNDQETTAKKILRSLKENSITSDELGMYWKENTAGYYYYQAPVETQALLIETFSEIENNTETIDNLKIWLLKNKQTNRWKTTKATTEAVYALLLNGSDWISVEESVAIKIGDKNIDPKKLKDVKVEAGTGYFKTSWNREEITPNMGEVTITKKENGIAWGGLYWQYFEDLDKITSAETPLKLKKKLFLKVNSETGKELKEINENTNLKVGDLITVRIELRADRAMEFIHMKDMRASGVEPINVLSKYKYQDGLGYYESTKDAATNFFFDRLPKGIYVFEYDVRVNNAGNFSNGITTIQSMYAPEYSSHSKGERIRVE